MKKHVSDFVSIEDVTGGYAVCLWNVDGHRYILSTHYKQQHAEQAVNTIREVLATWPGWARSRVEGGAK
jgi:hypothetical protein